MLPLNLPISLTKNFSLKSNGMKNISGGVLKPSLKSFLLSIHLCSLKETIYNLRLTSGIESVEGKSIIALLIKSS